MRPTGATRDGAATNPARPLTRREREVAALVADGLTNQQIASKLFISARTAEYHVEQIRNKFGFHTRSQIATWATQANGNAAPAEIALAASAALPPQRRLLVQPRLRAIVLTLIVAVAVSGGGLAHVLTRPASVTAVAPVDGIVQLDAATNRLMQTIPTGTRGSQIAAGEGAIWQISYIGRTLKRIDLRTRQVTQYGTTNGAPPVGIAIGDHAVWVATAYGAKSLLRFDPKMLQFGPPIEVVSGLQGIAFGANSVWVTDKNDNAVYRVDPLTARVANRIPVGDGPEAIAVSGKTVWVAHGVASTVSQIDADTSTVVATIPLGGSQPKSSSLSLRNETQMSPDPCPPARLLLK
jgi:YVTN family beta-propeller protein